MEKSPAVLRATKHAVRQVRTMDFDQSYDYLAAKGQAIKVGDPEDSYNTGLKQFLDEKAYKPTFQPFKIKEGAASKPAKARKPAAKKSKAKSA
jgi:trans-feruloyl-CoA hydratase/vanillin synthase